MTSVVVCSGGMDSTVLAYLAAETDDEAPILVSFNYGQKHAREIEYAARTAARLASDHLIIDLHPLAAVLSSALTDPGVSVPEGHYAAETMTQTVVPMRNAIMASVATGIAASRGAERVMLGVHAGDHPIYPDCRPAFIDAFDHMVQTALGHSNVRVTAPFVHLEKRDIAEMGDTLGVPWIDTWSCYKGGDVHCGACGTCVERREAFELAGVEDPTVYLATPVYDAP